MVRTAQTDLEPIHPFLDSARTFDCDEERTLREALKRCPASTYEAACQFRRTANPEHLPTILLGVIERFVEPALQAKLKEPAGTLRLVEDLGLDSLALMEIVILAEEVFQLSIKNEELGRLQTLGDLSDFIGRKVRARPRAKPAGLMTGDLVLE
jgi:3-hydroxyacyl-[acyl-carrier-protein] dehydratase